MKSESKKRFFVQIVCFMFALVETPLSRIADELYCLTVFDLFFFHVRLTHWLTHMLTKLPPTNAVETINRMFGYYRWHKCGYKHISRAFVYNE